MQKILDKVWSILSWFGLVSVILLVILITNDVIRRYILNSPTLWTMETSLGIMILFGFLCAGYVLRENAHVCMTLVIHLIDRKTNLILTIINSIIGALMCAIMVYFAWQMAVASFRTNELTGMMGYPVYILKFSVVVGFALLGLQFIADAIRNFKLYRGGLSETS